MNMSWKSHLLALIFEFTCTNAQHYVVSTSTLSYNHAQQFCDKQYGTQLATPILSAGGLVIDTNAKQACTFFVNQTYEVCWTGSGSSAGNPNECRCMISMPSEQGILWSSGIAVDCESKRQALCNDPDTTRTVTLAVCNQTGISEAALRQSIIDKYNLQGDVQVDIITGDFCDRRRRLQNDNITAPLGTDIKITITIPFKDAIQAEIVTESNGICQLIQSVLQDAVIDGCGTTQPEPEPCITACQGKKNGNYKSCLGCDFYATCSNEIFHEQQCPNGLHWNDITKICDWQPSPTCTNAPTSSPTDSPTDSPTNLPTDNPTDNPTISPTNSPTTVPTNSPTDIPTVSPSNSPTNAPSNYPTNDPTPPTDFPTKSPTKLPTSPPTNYPTNSPIPTVKPSDSPTNNPTNSPTSSPTNDPTESPTNNPTNNPTNYPSNNPTNNPTEGTCITSCEGRGNGDYQSCNGCNVYASCSEAILIDDRPCPKHTLWNDHKKICDWPPSPTCVTPSDAAHQSNSGHASE